MKVFLFTETISKTAQRLMEAIELFVPTNEIDIFHSILRFSNSLQNGKRNGRDIIAIILCEDTTVFNNIFTLMKELDDIRIVIILPRRDDQILAQGLRLYPRFIAYTDDNFLMLGAVLNRMVQQKQCSACPELKGKEPARIKPHKQFVRDSAQANANERFEEY